MSNVAVAEVNRVFDSLQASYSFLYKQGSHKGHWCEVRATALAAMCLAMIEEPDARWIKAIRSHLNRSQIRVGAAAGSWGEEIWDTAMCVLALKEMRVPTSDDVIARPLAWVSTLYSRAGRFNWHDELWETSWGLLMYLHARTVPPSINLSATVDWIIGYQDSSGRIVAPHYTAYLILASHYLNSSPFMHKLSGRVAPARELAVQYLTAELRDVNNCGKLWTGEAWSNGQILWALALSGTFPINDIVLLRRTIDWFVSHQDPKNGNWDDIEDTACATLGLTQLLIQAGRVTPAVFDAPMDDPESYVRSRLRSLVTKTRLLRRRLIIERNEYDRYISLYIRESTLLGIGSTAVVVLLAWLSAVLGLWSFLSSLFH